MDSVLQAERRPLEIPRFAGLAAWLERQEARLGVTGTGALLAAAVFLVAILYAFPMNPEDQGYVRNLIEKAADPLAVNDFVNRVFTPGLAWLLGGSKYAIVFVNLAFAFALLVAIYWHARRSGWAPLLAASMVLLIGTAITTLLATWWLYFNDPPTYFLAFFAFVLRARPLLSWFLMALAFTNHETAIFYVPGILAAQLLAVPAAGVGHIARTIFGAAAMVAFGFAVMLAIREFYPTVSGGSLLQWFLADPLWALRAGEQFFFLGVFAAFEAAWLLPAAAALLAAARGWYRELAVLLALTLFPFGITVFATDQTRYLGAAFIAMVWAAALLRRRYTDQSLGAVLLLIAGINLVIPQAVVLGSQWWPMPSALHALIRYVAGLG